MIKGTGNIAVDNGNCLPLNASTAHEEYPEREIPSTECVAKGNPVGDTFATQWQKPISPKTALPQHGSCPSYRKHVCHCRDNLNREKIPFATISNE